MDINKKLIIVLFVLLQSFFCIQKEQAAISNQKQISKKEQTQSVAKKRRSKKSILQQKKIVSLPKKQKTKVKKQIQSNKQLMVQNENADLHPQEVVPVDLEEINKIRVLIYVTAPSQPGSDKALEKVSDITITELEINRPTIDGRMRTLEELIFDKLLYFEAVYFYRFVLPTDAIDKYISSIKEQYHISDERLREMFLEAGYTYEEAREQFAMGQSLDALLNFKIRARLVIPEKDIHEYYDAHPVYEEASYRIKKGFIPDGILSEEELDGCSSEVFDNSAITWSMGYWMSEDEMNDERKEIIRLMKENECTRPEAVTGGYEVTKVLAVRPRVLKTFEERYREIMIQLQEPQYYKMLSEFKKELLSKYEVVYL